MLFAQITDLHVSTPDSPIDRAYGTAARLERAVAHLNDLDPRPELVLATGDLIEKGTEEEYRRLRQILSRLAMPVYLIPGNHDDRDALRRSFPDHGYLPADGTFLHYVIEDRPLRLIGLDTVVPRRTGGALCSTRLDWLRDQLARAPERPTVIFMHHPPFRTGMDRMDGFGMSGGAEMELILSAQPQVERVLCGHMHRAITRRFGGTVASVCPSTSHQIALDLRRPGELATTREPPACMLHLWFDGGDGLVSHLSFIEPAVPQRPPRSQPADRGGD